jgi:hypothetical protein
MTFFPDAASQPAIFPQVLLDAEAAARSADRERAYRLSREAARVAPDYIQSWLLLAETTPSIEEAVECLNKVAAWQPEHPALVLAAYHTVQRLLEKDAFLLYLDETDHLYRVRSGAQVELCVPKDRAVPEPYPAARPERLRQAYRWLGLAFLGLPLGGLGALVFAPPAAWAAARLYFETASRRNRVYSLIALLLAGGLWLIGLLLVVILLMHLV